MKEKNHSMLKLTQIALCALLTSCFTEPLLFSELFQLGHPQLGSPQA